MSLGKRYKDPQETRLFTFDWADHLGVEEISTSTFTVEDGITHVTDNIVDGNQQTSILLSGGTEGVDYTITNTITIADTGETLERSGVVAVRQQ